MEVVGAFAKSVAQRFGSNHPLYMGFHDLHEAAKRSGSRGDTVKENHCFPSVALTPLVVNVEQATLCGNITTHKTAPIKHPAAQSLNGSVEWSRSSHYGQPADLLVLVVH